MDLRRRLLAALLLLLAFTVASSVGYMLLAEGHVSLLDSLYMAVITLASVGYGEIVDTSHNPTLRVFNIFVVLVGVAVTLYVFSVVTAFFVEGDLKNVFWRRKMQKKISQLERHYIVCGLGNAGRYVIDELQKTGRPFVVIEHDEEAVNRLREHQGEDATTLYVIGDATEEETLDAAGVERAVGVIAALDSDKDNLVVTVMVRQKNGSARIVAGCQDMRFQERLTKAGANATVSPAHIGGLRMASEVIRPHVVGFLDLMLKEQSRTLRIEDIEIAAGSSWLGHTLSSLRLSERFNVMVLAMKDSLDPRSMNFRVNPPADVPLPQDAVIVVMGDVQDIERARQDAAARMAAVR
jgi:voltage-gated potassium channel